MSTARLARELGAARSRRSSVKPPADAFTANVEAMNRRKRQEKEAALALVAFAQALAGTVMLPPDDPEPAAEPEPAPAEPSEPPRPPRRPDQHTLASFEEAWGQPWSEGMKDALEPAPVLRGYDDPWGIVTPSYARVAEEGEE